MVCLTGQRAPLRVLACLLYLFACGALQAAQLHYPRAESQADLRSDYPLALLQLALQKAGAQHTVVATPMLMQQNRAIAELANDSGLIDIMATMTSTEREQQLLPIRIPLSKGLIGWRVALLQAKQVDQFRSVKTLAQLAPFQAGQGHDWPDTAILRHNGLSVHGVPTYDSLFGMLQAGRIDWAPRSLTEIGAELRHYPTLAADPYLLLRYQAADYYFVNRNKPQLAEDVRRGLELALADGSFDRLFYAFYGPLLKQARLGRRRILDVPNPLLPERTPLERRELWLTMDEVRRRGLAE